MYMHICHDYFAKSEGQETAVICGIAGLTSILPAKRGKAERRSSETSMHFHRTEMLPLHKTLEHFRTALNCFENMMVF